jgi:hypothetical protein
VIIKTPPPGIYTQQSIYKKPFLPQKALILASLVDVPKELMIYIIEGAG